MNFEDYGITGATEKISVDKASKFFRLKTRMATFSLRPIKGEKQSYTVQVTSKDLPGPFKNSGISSFGWFIITRYPGRNAVNRPRSVKPTHGNAVLMWPHLAVLERNRCLEHLEKLIRSEIPRLELEEAKQ